MSFDAFDLFGTSDLGANADLDYRIDGGTWTFLALFIFICKRMEEIESHPRKGLLSIKKQAA